MSQFVEFAPFGMVVVIVAMAFAYRAHVATLKFRAETHGEGERRLEQRLDDLATRLEKIERRTANLETIMLETEKHREFERGL